MDLWIPTSFGLAALSALGAHRSATRAVRAGQRQQRDRADAYLEIAEVLMVALDLDGRVTMANRMACETLGRDAGELLGADWFEIGVPEADREMGRAAFAWLLGGDVEVVREYEMPVRCADGSTRLIEWHHAITHDARGDVTGTLSSGLDITERRAAEGRLAREQRDLAGLRRLAQAVASQEDARNAVVRATTELAGAEFTALCELEPAGMAFAVTACSIEELIGERIGSTRDSAPSGVARAAHTRAPFFVSDGRDHPAVNQELVRRIGARSFLYHPIEVGGDVTGVLVVGWAEDIGSLRSREADLVALAADEAAVALHRRATMRELQAAALSDPLTGIANRRAFDGALTSELNRARRSKRPFALALMDLNAFKALNDTEGHEAGDLVLRAVAGAWIGELRVTDTLARLGGDEFAALLPDCGEADVPLLAARLRKVVPHRAGAGIGVAVWDGVEDAAALVRRADQALYGDKARLAADRLEDTARLAAVDAVASAGGAGEKLDDMARTIAWALRVPVAAVTLVTADRQHFAGQCGLDAAVAGAGVPLSHSFCQHPVTTGRPLVITDTRTNPIAVGNLAVDELDVLAYAGVPLIDADGHALGSICAVDHVPHEWREEDLHLLHRFAERAVLELARAAGAPVSA